MIAYILALMLVAGIVVAEAEVTWILWTRSRDGTWTRRAAWDTKSHCEDPVRAPRALTIFDERDPLGILDDAEQERKCLPDTVDPRGRAGQDLQAPSHLRSKLVEKIGIQTARIEISNRMEAQLTGKGFSILASTPGLQAVGTSQLTRWKWEATPTEYGTHTLYLALSAYIDVAGQATPLVVRTFERTIKVEVTVPQLVSGFAQNNWKWLWATVLLPIAGYLWRRWKKSRDARAAVDF